MVYAEIPFDRALAHFFADNVSPDYKSPVTGAVGTCTRRARIGTFPKYLWFHLRKYRLSASWTPEKLDTSIDFPMELDLSSMKG